MSGQRRVSGVRRAVRDATALGARRIGRTAALAVCAVTLAACAGQPDHFYTLSTTPQSPRAPAAGFATHVILSVSIPSLVDRRQMIVETSGDQILVLEHERWAAPLSDLVTQTLARDLERRRSDVLVADRSFDQAGAQSVRIKIELVRMSARRGGQATLEAHWRIVDPGAQADLLGGETFTAPIEGEDYGAIARAFSACLAALADRLVEKLPAQ
jgi:uncharacterized lipoprotein YmbA